MMPTHKTPIHCVSKIQNGQIIFKIDSALFIFDILSFIDGYNLVQKLLTKMSVMLGIILAC